MQNHLEKAAVIGWMPDWMPEWVMPAVSVAGIADAIHSNIRAKKIQNQLLEQQKQLAESSKFNQRLKDIGGALLGGVAVTEGVRALKRFAEDKPLIQLPDIPDILDNKPESSKKMVKKASESFINTMMRIK
jgi:hypothetical protein